MVSEESFLAVLKNSFNIYLKTDARSNEKLKVLHKKIAEDFLDILGEKYIVNALGLPNELGQEIEVIGKYYNKKVDITISKDGKNVAGIGVKFVMSNYSQNSNNYFENMMGETANLRMNCFKYYQVFIIFDRLPYFKDGGIIQKIETITEHNINKYIMLGKDEVGRYMHIPNKILLYVIHINPLPNDKMIGMTKIDYVKFYESPFVIGKSQMKITTSANVVYNNYENFVRESCYDISNN